MKKRVVSLICILALLFSMTGNFSLTASAAEKGADDRFRVGYSRVDINPYVVDGDPSSGIMALPLAGTGDVWNRLSKSTLMDDNGDGVVDEKDGLKATCIAVTDAKGNTVLLITVDIIGMTFLTQLTEEITKRVEAEVAEGNLRDVILPAENIYAASTHTHNAPDTGSYRAAGRTGTNAAGQDIGKLNEDLGMWIDRTVEDIGDAAILALQDRAYATLSKDQLSAEAATAEAVAGKTMTMTRHYVVNDEQEPFVAGDNFNATSGTVTGRGNDPQQVTDADDNIYLLNFRFDDPEKLPIVLTSWRGHPSLNNSDTYENSSSKVISSDYVNAFRHALEYGVDVTVDKTTGVGNVTGWSLGTEQKYRVAFFNSTGGNTNPRGYELERDDNGDILKDSSGNIIAGYTWIDTSATTAPVKGRGCSYGMVLATFANECITDGKNETDAAPGEIVTATKTFKADRKTVGCSQLAYDAGQAYATAQTLYNAAIATYTPAKNAYNTYVDAQNKVDKAGFLASILGYTNARDKAKTAYETAMAAHNAALEPFVAFMTANTLMTPTNAPTGTSYAEYPKYPQWAHPWIYKSAEGEVFVIGSKYHASYVVGDWNNELGMPHTAGINVTISAFVLGDDIAFVTIPGEPFDYYFKERGIYTPENNMWNDLLGDSYGKPYILGYTNGWLRYFPNIEAYYYNEGSTTKTFASYEVHNSDFEAGTGERTIAALDSLLAGVSAKTKENYCQHCKATVSWEPYRAETKLDSGHYYLCSDFELPNQLRFTENCTVCFDLNGYDLSSMGRAFYLDDNLNETLSVMDTSGAQSGIVRGVAAETGAPRSYGGGTVYLGPGCTMNLYSGTMTVSEKTNYSCQTGSVIRARGTCNVYGGQVIGGAVGSFTGQYVNSGKVTTVTRQGMGGAIYVDGSLHVYGGSITGGKHVMITGEVFGNETVGYGYRETVEEIEGAFPCVYVSQNSPVTLSGNGSIEKLYLAGGTAAKLTIRGRYTGTVELGYPAGTQVVPGVKIATADKADVSGAEISFLNVENLTAAVKGGEIIVSETSQSYIYCRHCQAEFLWTPVSDAELDLATNTKGMKPGHYILTENVSTTQKQLNPDGANPGNFCFDLNGYEFHGSTRAFYVYDNATLNLQDSVGGGFVQGDKGANNYGGSLYCQGAAAVINVYGTTVKGTPVTNLRGSAVFIVNGTVNLYDACILGNYSGEYGGTIFAGTNAKLNVRGGHVIAGSTGGKGACVFLDTSAGMTMAGNAVIDEIYVNGKPEAMVTVNATDVAFTGSAVMEFVTSVTTAGTDVGNVTGDQPVEGSITVKGTGMPVIARGANLMTGTLSVEICTNGAASSQYATLHQALAANTGSYIRLAADLEEQVTVTRDVYLDLAGHDLSGTVIVAEGATLYVMDSATDDYTVMDETGYGQLFAQVTGNLQPVPANTVAGTEGYMKVTRPEGVSFHRVNLQIGTVTLRPGAAGLYYNCNFLADEVAAEEIYGFGVALSVYEAPNGDNLETFCEYTAFDVFEGGPQGNRGSGTLLKNVMKMTNSDAVNAGNANTLIYGRAYILTESGYVFGDTVAMCFRELVCGADALWSGLTPDQQEGLLNLFMDYEAVMKNWELPNVKGFYYNESRNGECV